jgi:hypothetical protein
MPASRFAWTGVDEFHKRMTKAGTDLIGAVGRALYTEAEIIKEKSVQDTPVETGALRGSHRVEKPLVANDFSEIRVDIRVGGPSPGHADVHYAVYVHERLDLHHPVGKAKFLEDQVNAAAEGLDARILSRVQSEF